MPSFKVKFSGVTILQGVEISIFLLIFEWALQQCSATALPVMLLGGIAVLPTLMRPIVNCYRPCSMVCWSVCPPVSPSVRRAGSVWIFQFRFDSVQFSVSSTLFQFFGFGIRIPLQCNSIPERENTKIELINIHGKFPSKYIDQLCRV